MEESNTLTSPIRAMCLAHIILISFISVMLHEQYKLWSSSIDIFLCIPVTFCLLGLNILSTYFLNGNSNKVKYLNRFDIEIKMKYRQHWKIGQEIRYEILRIAYGNLKRLHRKQLCFILNSFNCLLCSRCLVQVCGYHTCVSRLL